MFCIVLVFSLPFGVKAQSAVAGRQAELEKQLAALESQINAQQKILEDKQRQSVSLERDIAILNAKIEKAKLNIKARNIAIAELSNDIADKQTTIGGLESKLDRERESLAAILRRTNEIESHSLVEVMLDNQNISEFFQDLDSFVSIKTALRDSFTSIKENKTKTENEKSDLEEKKQEQLDLKAIQVLEQRRVEEQQKEKQDILKISKGVEEVYQKVIKAAQGDAAKIRAELFTLRGSAAIPFEKALDLATEAKTKTGVRPAFLLGIIAEESNLGENIGKGNWRVDMANPRDTAPFQQICSALGLDPDKMPVSAKAWYGYGGAMGPAQFLPSTWVLYEDKISAATGHNPPNPWDPGDAFMAAALYLKDSGAAKQTVAAERYAALCYLAGCKNAGKKSYQFYADDVMDLAAKYQNLINILQAS